MGCGLNSHEHSPIIPSLSDGTPRIHNPPANVTVLLGQPFSLTCVVTGYPPPSITWNLNMALFNPNFFTGVSYSSVLGLLQFTEAKEDFLGEYTCEARNEHGTVTSEPASVRVQCESGREVVQSMTSFPVLCCQCCVCFVNP